MIEYSNWESATNEEILQLLMEDYGTDAMHVAFSYVKDYATAEDLAQEAFIKVYQSLHQFKGNSSIKTWVLKITINHCKDYLRSWHYRTVKLAKDAQQIFGIQKSTDQIVLKNSMQEQVTNHVLALPLKYREVIFLYFYEELNVPEISDLLNVNPNTIKSRLLRAKKILKDQLGSDFNA
ncbi:sigma-70 family RNA polymerase sigma factor [Pseudalkalibacillus sp. Hm43]|uniref:sigma-70 family RNA polymerase sigma factor n=1 Tax=Pseudalkalibacillus sp. Hm43 TaxID=3450742 RepID=UPI003F42C8B5